MAFDLCSKIWLGCASLVLLLSLSCQVAAGVSNTSLSPQEMAGLQALWKAWKDHSDNTSYYLQNWGNSSIDPCSNVGASWSGVECYTYNVGDRYPNGTISKVPQTSVYALYLSNSHIVGVVPPEVSWLNNLQFLYLDRNNLSGEFPFSSFSNAPFLSELLIRDNQLEGTIGDSDYFWNHMPMLKSLDLASNNFTGPVPDLSRSTSLAYIDLSGNRFSGSFPTLPTNYPARALLDDDVTFNISWNLFEGEIPQFPWDAFPEGNLTRLDLSNNKFSGSLPDLTDHFPRLTVLDLSNNKLTGQLPSFANSTALKTVNLSSNRFFTGAPYEYLSSFIRTQLPLSLAVLDLSDLNISGPFPDRWFDTNISELYLDRNKITGILNISAYAVRNPLKASDVLSLRNNRITGVISTETLDNFLKVRSSKILLQGNPYCSSKMHSEDDALRCSTYCGDVCRYSSHSHRQAVVAASASTASSAIILFCVILGFAFILRRDQKHIRDLQRKIKEADINAKRFEYNELRAATRNFAPDMKLGAGAYGAVYKGILVGDVVVAVKQLFLETNEGRDDFVNEVLLITNLQHRNLVTLKGYCLHGKQTLLVYEYVENLDLDKILLSRKKSHSDSNSVEDDVPVLDWQARLNVCRGVAQGLYYLHASSQSRIIHRDIKASNILLDKNLQPKIADFGLARPIEDARSIIVTNQVAGTLGYLAPEYICHGQLSDKSDVFSFGVLLLEIVSGKRNRDLTMPEDEVYLPNRAWMLHREDRLLDMKDPTMDVSEAEAMEVQRVLETAVLCVQSAPEKRPSMFQVAAMLARDADVDVPPTLDDHLDSSWPAASIGELLDESDSCENPLMSDGDVSSTAGASLITNGSATLELGILRSGR